MGWFGKKIGSVDSDLLASGILGRGEITHISGSGMTFRQNNGLVERKCTISLVVMIDNTQPYQVNVEQRIPEIRLPQLSQQPIVAVRVDPANHNNVCIDFNAQVPVVTVPRSTGPDSAAHILETGKPVKVVLVANQPMGLKNADGHDMQMLTLTVYEGVDTPYQTKVGNPVPATALPLLYPGSKLHAKLGSQQSSIVVDWSAGAAT